MPIFLPETNKKRPGPTSGMHRYRFIGYRMYPTREKERYADENNTRFRRLLLSLKDSNPAAIELFSSLLCLIYDDVLGGPSAIACVPSSSKSTPIRADALAKVAQAAVGKNLGVIDGSSWLQRKYDVPSTRQDPSMRDYTKQFESIHCVNPSPGGAVSSILLVDDIRTSGQTMDACVDHLHAAFPAANITAFAFGHTGWVPDISPVNPVWPDKSLTVDEARLTVMLWRMEAWPLGVSGDQSPFFSLDGFVHREGHHRCQRPSVGSESIWDRQQSQELSLQPCVRCQPFERGPFFVINRYGPKIHHSECHTAPSGKGHELLWNLRQGLRLGGKPCVNCMHSWPVASQLIK
jgi:predicted amidophosphoribosyltransferase